jgi:hypothetical protein
MRLTRRGALAAGAGGLGAALLPRSAQARRLDAATSVSIAARPIPAFLPRSPELKRFGSLEFRSGLVLSSTEPAFGGLSGLSRSADGSRIVAVTDRGSWLTARLLRAERRLSGVDDAVMAPMLNAQGRPLGRSRSYDVECLCIDKGVAFVGVERTHEALRFDWGRHGVAARGQSIPMPPEARRLPANRSLEAIGVAPASSPVAGALVALAERSGDVDQPTAGFIVGGPRPGLFSYRLQDGYDVTDLAFLPNGDMLVLERWYRPWRGVGMRVRRVDGERLGPGSTLEGATLIEADLGHEIDNMEGMSVHVEEGRVILTLISDDNFSMLQRTVLLEFEIALPNLT